MSIDGIVAMDLLLVCDIIKASVVDNVILPPLRYYCFYTVPVK